MMSASWKNDQDIVSNLVNVKHDLKEWKFHTFDQVLHVKKQLMARIDGVQRRIQSRNGSRGLWMLENNLQNKLRDILKKEELMWFQRSREKWLIDGDRNTRYYHMKAITRRRKNNVLVLKNNEGHWIEDVNQLHGLVTEFYQNLFTANPWFVLHPILY
jgi:hypothetical protein